MDYHNNNSITQQGKQAKAEPVKPVVKGKATTVKKGFFKQMWDDLVVSDPEVVKTTLKNNVFIPGIKKLALDMGWAFLTTLLYNGRPNNTPTMTNIQTYSNPSYNMSGNGYWNSQRQQQMPPQTTGAVYNDILFDNAGDAQAVLNEMQQRVDAYGYVSVADMFGLAGLDTPNSNYMLTRWGWKNIIGSSVVPNAAGGFILNLPRPQYF